ncbi:MAG: hypothetical protein V4592_25310 [Bacteroidota bacterium]
MKKILFTAVLLISCLSFRIADAQIGFRLNLNIGTQPEWGPTGYDHVDYYYMPDVDAYYDVPTHQYVYFENNVWVHRTYLPARYRGYDVYNGYKVVVNRPNPWLRHTYYHNTYAKYKGRGGQSIIRDSRDVKYRQHWTGNNGRGPDRGPGRGPDRGPGRGPDRGHDNGNHGGGRGPGGGHGPGGDHGNGHGPGGDHGNGHGHGQ